MLLSYFLSLSACGVSSVRRAGADQLNNDRLPPLPECRQSGSIGPALFHSTATANFELSRNYSSVLYSAVSPTAAVRALVFGRVTCRRLGSTALIAVSLTI